MALRPEVCQRLPRTASTDVLGAATPKQRLERALGVRILLYRRSSDHNASAYADPGKGTIELSWPVYLRVLNLRRWAFLRLPLARRHAYAAYEVAHELGHLNRGDSEDAANRWAGKNYRYVLSRLGLNKAQRGRMFRLARQQYLV